MFDLVSPAARWQIDDDEYQMTKQILRSSEHLLQDPPPSSPPSSSDPDDAKADEEIAALTRIPPPPPQQLQQLQQQLSGDGGRFPSAPAPTPSDSPAPLKRAAGMRPSPSSIVSSESLYYNTMYLVVPSIQSLLCYIAALCIYCRPPPPPRAAGSSCSPHPR